MLPHRLQRSKRPAESLPHQPVCIDRSLGKRQRAVFIRHLQPLLQQAHRQIGVLGHRVHRIAPGLLHGLCAPRPNRPRNHRHHIKQVQRPPLEVLAGDVFESLPARPQVHAIAHLRVARHRANLRILKVGNQLGDRIRGNHRIRIDPDVNLLVHLVQRVVQRGGFAPVRLLQHGNVAGLDLRLIRLARNIRGSIVRSVVDHDHANVVVVGVQHRADSAHDDLLFVVRRHQHGHPRIEPRRCLAMRPPQPVDDGKNAHQHQPRAHQHVANEEHEHDEVEDDRQRRERHCIRPRAHHAARR